MENPNYAEIVSEAAKWLDGVEPGWHKKIDRARLDIMSCTDCVLGQLYGEYDTGWSMHGALRYCMPFDPPLLAFSSFSALEKTPLWLAEIDARLEADKQQAANSADAFIARTTEIINQPKEAEYA